MTPVRILKQSSRPEPALAGFGPIRFCPFFCPQSKSMSAALIDMQFARDMIFFKRQHISHAVFYGNGSVVGSVNEKCTWSFFCDLKLVRKSAGKPLRWICSQEINSAPHMRN